MNAFGSYRKRQVIDFTELEEESIFLITGPTGAGKTTIFDAICYGLYGKASGSERDQEAFRSHFSSADDYTYVQLTFSLKGKDYKIERSPKQWKKKTRGEGYTEEPASAAFYTQTHDQSWNLEATKINEVNEAIEHLIGLDYEQFKKMIMIPQGEFRKLISENSREREEVLQKIFHTSFYRKITERLKEQSTALKNDIQLLENEIIQEYEKAGLEDHENPTVEDIEAIISNQTKHKKDLEKKRQEIHQELKAQQKRYTEQQQLALYFEEYRERQLEHEKLLSQQDEYQKWVNELQLADRAEKIQPDALLYYERQKEWEEQKKATAKLFTNLEALQVDYKKAKFQYEEEIKREVVREEKKMQWQKYQEVAHQLEDYEKNRMILKQKTRSIQDKSKESEQLHDQIQQLQQKDKLRTELATNIHANTQAMESTQHELTRIRQKEEYLQDLITLKKELDSLDTSLTNEQMLLHRVQLQLEQQTEKVNTVQAQYDQNMAVALADRLIDGEHCPVCGSTHHPMKASNEHQEEYKDAQLEQEMEKLASLEQELKKREHQVTLLTEQLRVKNEFAKQMAMKITEIVLPLSLDSLQTQLKHVQFTIRELLSANTKLEEEREQMIGKQKEVKEELDKLDSLEIHYKETIQQLEQLEEEHREAEKKFFRMEAYLPKDFHSVEAFLHETESIRKQYEQLETIWLDVKAHYETIRVEYEKVNVQYEQASQYESQLYQRFYQQEQLFYSQLKDSGFGNETNFRAALINQPTRERLEKYVEQYEDSLQSVVKRIETLKEWTAGKEEPNLSSLEEQINRLEQQRDEMIRELQFIELKISDLQQNVLKIKELTITSKELSEKYYHVGELAGLAKGENSMRLSFERYVLSTFLDEILLQANIRLSQMTDHRYQLIRSQELAKRGAQSGLDLEVFDHYTGKQRSVKTLSGGEGFKASLSLALGMADIIQAHAGGIQLDMLFIDEGFGTLDERSLEQAISCLKLLQENNRVLGIISHVPRLKEEIRAKLFVESTVDGSNAYFKL